MLTLVFWSKYDFHINEASTIFVSIVIWYGLFYDIRDNGPT